MRLDLAIKQAAERIAASGHSDSRLDAETLLMQVLGHGRAYLYAHPELELSSQELMHYHGLVERRAGGTPLQYITGHQEFWGLDLLVTPAVLIPRPETEHIVETALELLREVAAPRIVDVGTGSGCIALALASELPQAEIEAVDVSSEALEIARKNAECLGLAQRVSFKPSDLLQTYLTTDAEFDMVVSNPPYISNAETETLQREVREHEPGRALFAGPEGIDIYRRLVPQARRILKPGRWLVMEIGYSMEERVRKLLQDWEEVRSVPDLHGIPRVVVARKQG